MKCRSTVARTSLLSAVAFAVAACDSHPCWPDGPPPTSADCPTDRPYINRWHPGECYATPQREEPFYEGGR